MGVLDKFEKGVERMVSSAFAKAFRSDLKPVELASALNRAITAAEQKMAEEV